MPGNEIEITKYLVTNKGKISLSHIGIITSIGVPIAAEGEYREIEAEEDVIRYLSSEDSRKKADIYINNHGISIKQKGSSFAFNRLQRANILEIFRLLDFENSESVLGCLDAEVNNFHQGGLERRNRPWHNFFTENEFRTLVKYLMLEGSPNVGYSPHTAEFILEGPTVGISETNLDLYNFDEYFEKNKGKLMVAIRRQWVGQDSRSEHSRALGLIKKSGNLPWVFENVAGSPRSGWRPDYPPSERKTVYFLMIEKES